MVTTCLFICTSDNENSVSFVKVLRGQLGDFILLSNSDSCLIGTPPTKEQCF